MIFAGATWWGAGGVEAVLVRGRTILAAGSWSEIRAQAPGEQVVDLGGGLAIAGLADAHGHLELLGEAAEQPELRGCKSAAEVADLVRQAPRRRGFVRGHGWSDNGWPEPADARLLDEASRGDGVWLERADSHAGWANSALLARAGIHAGTADPHGGRIERRADGSPTGVLVDAAMALVEPLLPKPTPEELDARILLAARRCAAAGLTAIHDCGLDAASYASLRRLDARGALPIRVYGMERELDPQADAVLGTGPYQGDRLTLRAVKFFCDGALGSRGAAFFEPYADSPTSGLLLEAREDLARKLARRMAAGYQVALHAIGDRAVALALDAIADALASSGARDARPRIEHAQHVRLRDLPRFHQLGVVASMQPMHHANDWPWAKQRLGTARYQGAYAWRSMLRAGAPLAFGSDFPIESQDPRTGLSAAILRDDPAERLSADDALRAFTLGAAYASFREREVAVVAPGYRADFAVFAGDPRVDPKASRTVMTVLDGQPL